MATKKKTTTTPKPLAMHVLVGWNKKNKLMFLSDGRETESEMWENYGDMYGYDYSIEDGYTPLHLTFTIPEASLPSPELMKELTSLTLTPSENSIKMLADTISKIEKQIEILKKSTKADVSTKVGKQPASKKTAKKSTRIY